VHARQLSALDFASCGGCRGNEGVEGAGGQHFRGRVGEVHGHERGAVLFVEVEACKVVVGVQSDGVLLQSPVSMNPRDTGGQVGEGERTLKCSVAL
jgi:hypothetical protein